MEPAGEPAGADDAVRAIERVLRRYLATFVPEGRNAKIAREHNLWREVSSLTMLQLVTFVEQKFAIAVAPIDFAPQNFSTIAAIARFVAARRAPAQP